MKWEKHWGKKTDIFLNHGQSNARGNAIVFNNLDFAVDRYVDDKNGRLQIMSIKVTDYEKNLLLINIYNENAENDQLSLLEKLVQLLDAFGDLSDHVIIFGGDFNLFFDRALDAHGGPAALKNRSLASLTNIIEKYDLVDIYRIRFPSAKRFSYRQNNSRIRRRLDFFLVSNVLQESIGKADILTSVDSDHSPVYITFKEVSENEKGQNYWKFNTSLLKDPVYVEKLIGKLHEWFSDYANESPQLQWELIKYETRKFTMQYSKEKARATRATVKLLEEQINDFETNALSSISSESYSEAKHQFEEIKNEKAIGQILRSKCSFYEDGEKSSKFFLNLEKNNAIQSSIRAIFDENDTEITEKQKILDRVRRFYSSLFSKKVNNTHNTNMACLRDLGLPTLSENQVALCETDFTIDDLFETVKSMQGGKSPGNDGLGK